MYNIEQLENYCKQAIDNETLNVRVNFFGNEGHFPMRNFVNEIADHLTDRIYGYIREEVETKEQALEACKNAIKDCIHDAYFVTGGEWWIYNNEWKEVFNQYQDDIDQIIDSYGCSSLQEITRDSTSILDMEMRLVEYAVSAVLSYYECLCEEDDNVDSMWNEIIK